jgi:hypothetical protein
VGAEEQAVTTNTPTPPAPADDASGAEAMMPKDVPGAAEFRDAFKAAVPPRGADHASWVNGYCAGWIACEKAFPLPARDDTVEEAAERDSFCAYLSAQKPPIKPRWNSAKCRWEYRDGRPYPYCETAWRFWMARAALRREKGGDRG